MVLTASRSFHILSISLVLFLHACTPPAIPAAEVRIPDILGTADPTSGFAVEDERRSLTFPEDFGPHPDFRTEWWYYSGNLQTPAGRPFGFEFTIFRIGLLPPTAELPDDSEWYDHSLYFAHFAVSDIADGEFYAFERYSRPGPGLAGAQADPHRTWVEDWQITEQERDVYRLQAAQSEVLLDLLLTDEMGVVLHREDANRLESPSYYYSQPRLRAEGSVEIGGIKYPVSGLAWKDHVFSMRVLDENQVGWDWFSLQFEDGSALMIFELRERDGSASTSSIGTFSDPQGNLKYLQKSDYEIMVLDKWRSPHTGGLYPASWEIHVIEPNCTLQVDPWMADQEIHFPAVTYWEGAIHFAGTCNGQPASGNGYVELTGYAGNLPLP